MQNGPVSSEGRSNAHRDVPPAGDEVQRHALVPARRGDQQRRLTLAVADLQLRAAFLHQRTRRVDPAGAAGPVQRRAACDGQESLVVMCFQSIALSGFNMQSSVSAERRPGIRGPGYSATSRTLLCGLVTQLRPELCYSGRQMLLVQVEGNAPSLSCALTSAPAFSSSRTMLGRPLLACRQRGGTSISVNAAQSSPHPDDGDN